MKNNWVLIQDLLFFQEGPGVRKHQFTNKGVKLLNVGNINNNKITLSTTEKHVSNDEAYGKYKHFLVDDGDLLIACSGIVVSNFSKKIAFVNKEHLPLCLNTSTMRFKSLDNSKLDINYFYYFLMTEIFNRQLGRLITGSAQLNFGPSHIKKIKMPLVELPKQKAIAQKLDLAQKLIDLRKESITKLDDLAKSVFVEMFGDPVENVMGWEVTTLNKLGILLEGGKNIGEDKDNINGNRILKISAITKGVFDPNESKFLPSNYEVPENYYVRKGDLLMSRANTSLLIGATAYVWKPQENIVLPDKIWRFVYPENSTLNTIFHWKLFQHEAIRSEISKRASGTGGSMKNISKPKVLSIPIYLPPITLQNKFAQTIQKIEAQKTLYEAELVKLEEGFEGLLGESFD